METSKTTTSGEAEPVQIVKRREVVYRMTEIYIWAIAAVVVAGGAFFDLLSRRAPPIAIFADRYVEILFACAVFLFPTVYRLIFGALPLESLRRKRAQHMLETEDSTSAATSNAQIREAEIRVLTDAMSVNDLASSPATTLFSYYAANSRRLSQSIYSRAGVYLMVGVIIAFSGLVFFYSQTVNSAPITNEGIARLISLAPKFGILFFIEFVALFFLRQYRSAMDEFRYYEAIKRNREETLALIRMAVDSGKTFDPIDLVKNESFFSKAGVLEKGQSTDIIESRKLEKNELEILEKVVDLVSRSKK